MARETCSLHIFCRFFDSALILHFVKPVDVANFCLFNTTSNKVPNVWPWLIV